MKNHLLPLLAVALGGMITTGLASERHFAFTYETTTAAKGTFEFEEQVFWERGSGSNSFAFRQEIEYGVTDRFQLAVYLFDFEHTREPGVNSTRWAGSGLEAVYRLSDPTTDWIGSALYLEALASDSSVELEGKILLQKNIGPFILAYNGIIEAHWDENYVERTGVLEQTLGVSYGITPSLSVGLEAKHEVEFEDWSHSGGNAVFVGPNVSYHKGRFFAAVSCLFRASNVPGEPHVELGTVLGLHF